MQHSSLLTRFFKNKEALHCLLLPLHHMYWIIPSVAAVEVLLEAFTQPKRTEPLSSYTWRKETVPLLSAECLMGLETTANPQGRILVLHSTQSDTSVPFWALELQNLPRIVQLAHSDVTLTPENTLPPYIQAKIMLEGYENIYIPNLAQIEGFLEQAVTAV
jgi:chemosensory pili system protein ChpC